MPVQKCLHFPVDQMTIYYELLEWIAVCNIPASTLSHPFFQTILKQLGFTKKLNAMRFQWT